MSNATRFAWVFGSTLAIFALWLATHGSANAGIGFFYVVPIGLAAWWGGGRFAAIAVAGCVFLYILSALIHPIAAFGLSLTLRLIVFIAVAVGATLLRERLSVLEHEAEELEDIRVALTPTQLVNLPGVELGTAFVPSDHGVSGDFFLVTNSSDNSTIAIVGDVVGHGPDAARLATFIRARIATFVANSSDPGEILTLANAAMFDRPGAGHELVSAVCLRLEPGGGALDWAIGGHPPPLLVPSLRELKPNGRTLLLGADPDLRLQVGHIGLRQGVGVIAYSDGATDVRRDGRRLGQDGFERLIEPLVSMPPPVLASRAEESILEWTDEPLRDDLCLLALRSEPEAAASTGGR